jgi:hypothetical protein
MKLKGRRFDDADTIKMNMTSELTAAHLNTSSDVSRSGRNVRTIALSSAGDYFEGDN